MNIAVRQALPLLDMDVLRTFVAIAESGNFTLAADVVLRTPSAVSMQIKRLEDQLQTTLFLRDARSVSLTPHGELLLTYARRLLALNNEAVSRFLLPNMNGVVRLGAPDDMVEHILPEVLKRFACDYPNVAVDVTVASSTEIRRRVAEKRLDIGIFSTSEGDTGVDGEVLRTERIVWVGHRCSTAHLRKPLPVSLWEEGCVWRARAIAALENAGIAYRVAFLSAHATGQHSAIRADLAIAPMAAFQVQGDLVALGTADGLPEIGCFDICMRVANGVGAPVHAVADTIRSTIERIDRF